jgi:hypothetical protein
MVIFRPYLSHGHMWVRKLKWFLYHSFVPFLVLIPFTRVCINMVSNLVRGVSSESGSISSIRWPLSFGLHIVSRIPNKSTWSTIMWNSYPELKVILRHGQPEYIQHPHLHLCNLLTDATLLWCVLVWEVYVQTLLIVNTLRRVTSPSQLSGSVWSERSLCWTYLGNV